jgi:hypothetical protein
VPSRPSSWLMRRTNKNSVWTGYVTAIERALGEYRKAQIWFRPGRTRLARECVQPVCGLDDVQRAWLAIPGALRGSTQIAAQDPAETQNQGRAIPLRALSRQFFTA